MTKEAEELGPCQVRSETDRPCPRPAMAKIRGIPFCERCACEQEAYFAIGEFTKQAKGFRDEWLVATLDRMRRELAGCTADVGKR